MKRFKQYVIETTLVASATTPANSNIKIDLGRDFYCTEISGNATSASYTLRLRDSGTRNFWFDSVVNSANMVGINTLPLKLPVPKSLKGDSTLFYEITDTSVAGNTVHIVLSGYEIVPDVDLSYLGPTRDFMAYVIDATLAASQVLETNIKIDKSKNFVITHIVGNSTGAYSFQLSDSASGYTAFSNDKVRSAAFVGTAQFPRELASPIPMRGNSVLKYNLTDLSIGANTIQIVLIGYVAE